MKFGISIRLEHLSNLPVGPRENRPFLKMAAILKVANFSNDSTFKIEKRQHTDAKFHACITDHFDISSYTCSIWQLLVYFMIKNKEKFWVFWNLARYTLNICWLCFLSLHSDWALSFRDSA